MSLPSGRLEEPDFLLTAAVVIEAYAKRRLCHPGSLKCLISAEASYGPETLSWCYSTGILKLFFGAEKPGLF